MDPKSREAFFPSKVDAFFVAGLATIRKDAQKSRIVANPATNNSPRRSGGPIEYSRSTHSGRFYVKIRAALRNRYVITSLFPIRSG
ncbi:MAG TPA: hypothetical protein DDW52_02235 [Planctomycetaceae bacterium]|nr:hypothetical protein [Planctomycetaceae bacterium]